jgi:hypothetical protein
MKANKKLFKGKVRGEAYIMYFAEDVEKRKL